MTAMSFDISFVSDCSKKSNDFNLNTSFTCGSFTPINVNTNKVTNANVQCVIYFISFVLPLLNNLMMSNFVVNNNGEHFSKVTVNGNSNNMTIDQKETGDKILFLDVDGSNNVQVDQKGTGNHFLDINLTDSHTVDVTQDGSGSHNATIHLSGNPSSVTLTQDSSTNQNYHLQQSCSSSSCSATVTQN